MSLFADVVERVHRQVDEKEARKARMEHIQGICRREMVKRRDEINSLHPKLIFKPEYDAKFGTYFYVGMDRGPGNGRQLWNLHVKTWVDSTAASKFGEGFEIYSDMSHHNKQVIPFRLEDSDVYILRQFQQALRLLVKRAMLYQY